VTTPRTSVIVCTHNPRPSYLARVIAALQSQTVATSDWELLLVDNASARPLVELVDLSWHPNARHIREAELGLTPARARGIAEARGELLVFVDDDNVLAADYLESALAIAARWPQLGAWGGTVKGEFEVEPQSWMQPFLVYLCIRQVSAAIWSNNPEDWRAHPSGAGLCVRPAVARSYRAQLAAQPCRRRLDRVGQSLSSAGDIDLIHTSCDLGLGFGNFPELVLTHLIPARRVTPEYLIELMRGITISSILLEYYRSGVLPHEPSKVRTIAHYLFNLLTQDRHRAAIYKASREAVGVAARIARGLPAALSGAAPPTPPAPDHPAASEAVPARRKRSL
jgi:glycosyltransferase involved in cell wall biosynthesis